MTPHHEPKDEAEAQASEGEAASYALIDDGDVSKQDGRSVGPCHEGKAEGAARREMIFR
jgi:hypothetical protein